MEERISLADIFAAIMAAGWKHLVIGGKKCYARCTECGNGQCYIFYMGKGQDSEMIQFCPRCALKHKNDGRYRVTIEALCKDPKFAAIWAKRRGTPKQQALPLEKAAPRVKECVCCPRPAAGPKAKYCVFCARKPAAWKAEQAALKAEGRLGEVD